MRLPPSYTMQKKNWRRAEVLFDRPPSHQITNEDVAGTRARFAGRINPIIDAEVSRAVGKRIHHCIEALEMTPAFSVNDKRQSIPNRAIITEALAGAWERLEQGGRYRYRAGYDCLRRRSTRNSILNERLLRRITRSSEPKLPFKVTREHRGIGGGYAEAAHETNS